MVTGSEGFLGRHLCKLLFENGHQTMGVDFENGIAVSDFVKSVYPHRPEHYDCIIHLAAFTQVGWCWKNPAEAMRNNVGATLDMLNFAATRKTPIIVVTSDKVYAGGYETYNELSPQRGYCPYSASKVVCDELANEYQAFVNPQTYIVRFSNLIGYDDHNEARLFPRIRKALQDNTPLPFLRKDCVRDWLDVRDAARFLYELSQAGNQGISFNVVGESCSVGEIVGRFAARTNRTIEAKGVESGFYELDRLKVDSIATFSKMFKREFSLDDTINDCIEKWGVK